MQLNCKVIKKCQPPPPPHFYINSPSPAFLGLSPLSSKIFGTPQVTRFLEGPTPAPPLIRGGGVGRSNYDQPTKRMTNALLIIIAQCLFYVYVENFFERIIFNGFFYFLKIITYLSLINQVLGLMIHVSISFCQLCTVFI